MVGWILVVKLVVWWLLFFVVFLGVFGVGCLILGVGVNGLVEFLCFFFVLLIYVVWLGIVCIGIVVFLVGVCEGCGVFVVLFFVWIVWVVVLL